MSERKITVLFKEPGKDAVIRQVEDDYQEIQKLVDGYFECMPFSDEAVLIVNEEGKLRGMPFNFHCWDDIVGPAIVCGVSGEEFSDVPIKAVAEFGNLIGPVELGKVARYAG